MTNHQSLPPNNNDDNKATTGSGGTGRLAVVLVGSLFLVVVVVAAAAVTSPYSGSGIGGTTATDATGSTRSVRGIQQQQQRRTLVELIAVGQNPEDPLPLCGGDCDNDDECQEGLVCFQRETTEEVPGCDYYQGDASRYEGMDVCIQDPAGPTTAPTISPAPSVAPPPSISPTVEGTKSWSQTYGMTDAFDFVGPPSSMKTLEPTRAPKKNDNDNANADIDWIFDHYNASTPPLLEYVGNNDNPPEAFPLGPCQSDCDSDGDCAGPLVCFQRDGGESVPGCATTAGDTDLTDNEDYCIWPHDFDFDAAMAELEDLNQPDDEEEASSGGPAATLPSPFVTEGFALKLYWEEGYNWQNETFERKWCASRNYEGTSWTGKCWYGLDEIDCDPTELYINKCDRDDVRQRFIFVPVSSDEVMIQVYSPPEEDNSDNDNANNDNDESSVSVSRASSSDDRCFHRDNRKLKLQACDQRLHNQRWFALRGGFNEERFELSQKTQPDHCINQDHHPKSGEVLRTYDCKKVRGPNHLTSWWELY